MCSSDLAIDIQRISDSARTFNKPVQLINALRKANEDKQKADYALLLASKERTISDAILSKMGCKKVYADQSIAGFGFEKQAVGWTRHDADGTLLPGFHADWTVDVNNTIRTTDHANPETLSDLGLPAGNYFNTITFNTVQGADNNLYVVSENSITS